MKKILSQLLLNTPLLRNKIYFILHSVDKLFNRECEIAILCYHGIGNDTWRYSVSFSTLKKQILYLKKNGYTFIRLSDVLSYVNNTTALPHKAIVITIDDGYKEILQSVDFFKKHAISPTVFLLGNTKSPNRVELDNKRAFLTIRDVKYLIKNGWEIGSHSNTHSNLAMLTKKELEDEIRGSKKHLETLYQIQIPYFAYPRGKYTTQILNITKKAGYTLGLSMEDGVISTQTNHFLIPRIGVDRTHTIEQFPTIFSPLVITLRTYIKKSFMGRYL